MGATGFMCGLLGFDLNPQGSFLLIPAHERSTALS